MLCLDDQFHVIEIHRPSSSRDTGSYVTARGEKKETTSKWNTFPCCHARFHHCFANSPAFRLSVTFFGIPFEVIWAIFGAKQYFVSLLNNNSHLLNLLHPKAASLLSVEVISAKLTHNSLWLDSSQTIKLIYGPIRVLQGTTAVFPSTIKQLNSYTPRRMFIVFKS